MFRNNQHEINISVLEYVKAMHLKPFVIHTTEVLSPITCFSSFTVCSSVYRCMTQTLLNMYLLLEIKVLFRRLLIYNQNVIQHRKFLVGIQNFSTMQEWLCKNKMQCKTSLNWKYNSCHYNKIKSGTYLGVVVGYCACTRARSLWQNLHLWIKDTIPQRYPMEGYD